MTSATIEEVYNARNNTVEQRKVGNSRGSSNDNNGVSPPPVHDHDDDSRSMSSMSMLFRDARGGRQEDSKPSDYANYQFDDDATVDSLSDVFGKKTSVASKAAKFGDQAKTPKTSMLGPRAGSDRDVDTKDDTLAEIISSTVNLHDEKENDEISNIQPIEPDHIAGIAPTTMAGISDLRDLEKPEKDEEEGFLDENDALNITADTSSMGDQAELASSTSSSNSSSRRKKKSKKGMSNKKMYFWILGFVVLVAIAAVVYFQVYYKKRRGSKADSSNISAPTNMIVPTMPTQSPTKYGETHAPTTSLRPTNSPTLPPTLTPTQEPTINYIDPLMEFLQDNQVYFERDSLSPDYMAVQWLADEAQIRRTDGVSSAYGNGLELTDKLIQRFALLTLDFALLRPNTTSTADSAPSVNTQNRNPNDLANNALMADISTFEYETYARSNTIALKEVDECLWEGITCASIGAQYGQVEEINFTHAGLSGTIPPEINLLKSVKRLDLAGNNLYGSIPEALYKIKELEELYLYKNRLTGTISNSIGNWWNMTRLHLSHNELTGSIPLTYKSGSVEIRPIKYLNLYSNKLTGTIPDNFRFRQLMFADFGRNQFTGKLPEDIGKRWVELRFLYLNHNQFTGTIPSEYPTVGNGRIEAMTFNHNDLTGWVPGQFYLNKLLEFNVQDNMFTGIDYKACKQSVFDGGEMVEYKADCDICSCNPYCDLKCKQE